MALTYTSNIIDYESRIGRVVDHITLSGATDGQVLEYDEERGKFVPKDNVHDGNMFMKVAGENVIFRHTPFGD